MGIFMILEDETYEKFCILASMVLAGFLLCPWHCQRKAA